MLFQSWKTSDDGSESGSAWVEISARAKEVKGLFRQEYCLCLGPLTFGDTLLAEDSTKTAWKTPPSSLHHTIPPTLKGQVESRLGHERGKSRNRVLEPAFSCLYFFERHRPFCSVSISHGNTKVKLESFLFLNLLNPHCSSSPSLYPFI